MDSGLAVERRTVGDPHTALYVDKSLLVEFQGRSGGHRAALPPHSGTAQGPQLPEFGTFPQPIAAISYDMGFISVTVTEYPDQKRRRGKGLFDLYSQAAGHCFRNSGS